MRKWTPYITLMPVLLVQALSSCSLIDEPEVKGDVSVNASLAFTVSRAEKSSTRMTDAVVQEEGNDFRGLQICGMIPFAINGETFVDHNWKIVDTDEPSQLIDDASPVIGTTETFYLYRSYMMPRGVNAFLVYGRAPVGGSSKSENGSLRFMSKEDTTLEPLQDLTTPNLQKLRFALDPISSQAVPAEAVLLAGYLNNIAQTPGWNDTYDSFLFFTGLENEENNMLAGSCTNVVAHVNALYEKIYDSEESDLRTAILNRIMTLPATGFDGLALIDNEQTDAAWRLKDIEVNGKHYPASESLPDGAAALRWVKKSDTSSEYEFKPRIEWGPQDNINNISRFAYPAELFYRANSRIDTSNDIVGENVYSYAKWEDVCKEYQYQPGTVTIYTKSVAIHEPLQYAVGRLKMTMIAETTTEKLKDAAGKDVPLTNPTTSKSSFPLTGVIICNQHPVDFNFKPVLENGVASHADDCFIYDSQVGTDCFISTSEQNIPSTLVLQTYDTGEGSDMKGAEEVIIAMEFRNDSDQLFYGKSCVIYPGTKFYLIGKADPLEATSANATPEAAGRVFTQDHITTINTKVESLANAYNVLPDLIGGRLELGIELVSSWVQAETTNVILK